MRTKMEDNPRLAWATEQGQQRRAARDVRQETCQDARQTKQQGREQARDIKY